MSREVVRRSSTESGYAMAALLVGMAVMAVVLSVAMPVWSTQSKRVKEDELVFRGEQYARAIALYQRKYANASPPSIDVLVNERFLRKKYLDPMTGGEFQPLTGAMGASAPGGPGGAAGGRGGTTPGRSGGATGMGTGATASGGGGRSSGFGPTTSGGQGQTSSFGRGTTGFGSTTTGTGGPGGRAGGFGGAGGIVGVASKSTDKSLRLYNGRDAYNEWTFVPQQRALQAGSGGEGSATPGGPGGARGQPPGSRGTGARGFGSGSDPFRPSSGGFGSSGGFRSGGSPGGSSGRR